MQSKIRFKSVGLAVAFVSCAAGPSLAAQTKFFRMPDPVANEYLVVAKVGAFDQLAAKASASANLESLISAGGGQILHRWSDALVAFHVAMGEAVAIQLSNSPYVKHVEENSRSFSVSTVQLNPVNWGLERINQRNLPLGTSYSYTFTGNGIHAYVIDTGIRATHQDFLTPNRIGGGVDEIGDGHGTDDCFGHGTGVASIIGGNTYGVAKKATLHPVRVIDCTGHGTTAQIVAGANWVAANATFPAVANMSLGGPQSQSIDDAVTGMINAGVVTVMAAGNNSGASACNYSPGDVESGVTVGSSENNDAVSSFSNLGTCVDLFAPGGGITQASNAADNGQVTASGTSFASPHVAGVAAIYLESASNAGAAGRVSDVNGFLVWNATTSDLSGFGTSPNLLAYSHWSSHWLFENSEKCSDICSGSCSSCRLSPLCPARPVNYQSCSTSSSCWSVVSQTYAELYTCVSPN